MKKYIILIISLISSFFAFANPVLASDFVVTGSANTVVQASNLNTDLRVKRLEIFLKHYKSPLAEYAKEFVYWADKYNIDYRLVPAISGVESTFGKRIPYNSYNAYGWNSGNYKFKSWVDSIEHVNKTLRYKYYDKGADTIPTIAKKYAPPSTTWARNVRFFVNKIDSTPIEFDL